MKSWILRLLAVASIGVGIAAMRAPGSAHASTPAPPPFTVIALASPAPPPGLVCDQTGASAISPSGIIVGWARCAKNVTPWNETVVLWTGGTALLVGPPLPRFFFVYATQITDAGVAFVDASNTQNTNYAYRYRIASDGTYTRNKLVHAASTGFANANGLLAVGLDTGRAGTLQAPGVYTDISGGSTPSYAVGVNDAGDVVAGNIGNPPATHAFVYANGTFTPIPFDHGLNVSSVLYVTRKGYIIGSEGGRQAGPLGPVIWDSTGRVIFRTRCGKQRIYPRAANDRGDIVGWLVGGPSIVEPFIYLFKERTCLIGTQFVPLALISFVPEAINDNRQVVGYYGSTGAAVELVPTSSLRRR
jgi:hypothetical protein